MNQTPLTIQDLINLHAYLDNVKNPTETTKTCREKLEEHIKIFVAGLKSGQSEQPSNLIKRPS